MKKYIPTQETIDLILKMYNEEFLGSKTISEKIHLNQNIVLRILKENGVKVGLSGRRFIGGKKIADKKYREKETYTKEFWLSILTSASFREYIESKYRMAGGEMLGRSFDEVDLAEEFDNASEV